MRGDMFIFGTFMWSRSCGGRSEGRKPADPRLIGANEVRSAVRQNPDIQTTSLSKYLSVTIGVKAEREALRFLADWNAQKRMGTCMNSSSAKDADCRHDITIRVLRFETTALTSPLGIRAAAQPG